jgi:hypothetical protein
MVYVDLMWTWDGSLGFFMLWSPGSFATATVVIFAPLGDDGIYLDVHPRLQESSGNGEKNLVRRKCCTSCSPKIHG